MKVSEAFDQYLEAESRRVTGSADLIERLREHGMNLEWQCNVSSHGGEPVEGRRFTYTDGANTWYNFRVPRGAAADPHWKDYELRYDMQRHVSCVGSTGFDWVNKQSVFVGFDFDSIVGHTSAVGLDDDTLEEVKREACAIPWVMVRHSTSGSGLHLYVFLNGIFDIQTHTEHAAVARSVLGVMSEECGWDFSPHVDVCGMVLWCAASRAEDENGSFACVKEDTELFDNLNPNWRDHIDVVSQSHRRRRLIDKQEDELYSLTSAYPRVPLEPAHETLRDRLEELAEWDSQWCEDRGLLQTHTSALKHIKEKFPEEYKGVFETDTSNSTRCNAFAYPVAGGAWKIIRFGEGCNEHPTWTKDKWTWCWFNKAPGIDLFATPTGRRNEFSTTIKDINAAYGLDIDAGAFNDCELIIKKEKRTLYVKIDVPKEQRDDIQTPSGWRYHRGFLERTLVDVLPEAESIDSKKLIRFFEGEGYRFQDDEGNWHRCNTAQAAAYICGKTGCSQQDAKMPIADAMAMPWTSVYEPFGDEYPRERVHNRAKGWVVESCEGEHPTWSRVWNHLGKNLTPDDWCREHGIATGGDFLLQYVASIARDPMQSLPLLSFFSEEEGTGKSTLHRALALLWHQSLIVRASRELKPGSRFNSKLQSAVIAFVDEHDLSDPQAMVMVRQMVDSPDFDVEGKGIDSRDVPNNLHFIQTTNHREFAPVRAGDTRIILTRVDRFEGPELDWETTLKPALQREAPAFRHTLETLQLPEAHGRLYLPVLETPEKRQLMEERSSSGWLDVLVQLAIEGKVKNLPASDLLGLIKSHCKDRSLTSNVGGFAKKLKSIKHDLEVHNLRLVVNETDRTYTITS